VIKARLDADPKCSQVKEEYVEYLREKPVRDPALQVRVVCVLCVLCVVLCDCMSPCLMTVGWSGREVRMWTQGLLRGPGVRCVGPAWAREGLARGHVLFMQIHVQVVGTPADVEPSTPAEQDGKARCARFVEKKAFVESFNTTRPDAPYTVWEALA
jgi:hypothetical protein